MKQIWDEILTIKEFQTATVRRMVDGPEVTRRASQLRIIAYGWWDKGTGTLRIDLACQQRMEYSEAFPWHRVEPRQVLVVVYGSREKAIRHIIAEIEDFKGQILECFTETDQADYSDAEIIQRWRDEQDQLKDIPF